jgi:hypothetical protein
MLRLPEQWRAKQFRAAAFVRNPDRIACDGRAITPSAMVTEVDGCECSFRLGNLGRRGVGESGGPVSLSHIPPARRRHLHAHRVNLPHCPSQQPEQLGLTSRWLWEAAP